MCVSGRVAEEGERGKMKGGCSFFVSMKQCVTCHFQENDEKMEMSTNLPSKCVRCVREEGVRREKSERRGRKERWRLNKWLETGHSLQKHAQKHKKWKSVSGEASACMMMNIYACADEAVSVSECCVCDLSVAAHVLTLTYMELHIRRKSRTERWKWTHTYP